MHFFFFSKKNSIRHDAIGVSPYLAGATTPVSTALERSPVEKEENKLTSTLIKLMGKLLKFLKIFS